MTNPNWNWRPLGELFEIGAGKTMSAAARAGADKVPFLRTSNVLWDEIDLTQVDEMSISPTELVDKSLKAGDLLVCEGGEIGRAAVWDGRVPVMSFQNHLHRLRRKQDDVDAHFYVYFLQSAFTQLGIFEGAGNKTTIPNLSRNRLAALDVPHPPKPEQQSVAQVLAKVREAIAVHDQATSTALELKHAVMNDLFTRGLRGEPQKETEIGLVPESWAEVSIADLGEIVTGTTPPTRERAYYDDGNIPFISPGDIEHGTPIASTQKCITDSGLAVSRALPAGTTCVVCIGSTIGKVGRTTAAASATNQQINAIVPGVGYDPNYLSHLLTYQSNIVRNAASPSPVPILSKGAFEKLVLFTSTNPDEQVEIATILDAVDRKIDLHQKKRKVVEELFESLLHKLMTGEIAVSDLDLSALAPASTQHEEATA